MDGVCEQFGLKGMGIQEEGVATKKTSWYLIPLSIELFFSERASRLDRIPARPTTVSGNIKIQFS